MRQLNKTWAILLTNVITLLSETIIKILTLNSRKPSVQNRVSGSSGCPVMSYLLCELQVDSGLIITGQLLLCMKMSIIEMSPQNLKEPWWVLFLSEIWTLESELVQCGHFLFSFEINWYSLWFYGHKDQHGVIAVHTGFSYTFRDNCYRGNLRGGRNMKIRFLQVFQSQSLLSSFQCWAIQWRSQNS